MMDNSSFAAAAELTRMGAFVKANRASVCTRCGGNDFDALDKRGHCGKCSEARLKSMAADALPNHSVGVPRGETAAEVNERLRKAKAARDAIKPDVTIKSLLAGPSGHCMLTGMDLCHANSAFSGRVSIMEVQKKLGPIETFLISHPGNTAAWDNYERRFEQMANLAKDVKFHENILRESYPALICEPLLTPEPLQRGESRAVCEL